jgi:hypothetical protein
MLRDMNYDEENMTYLENSKSTRRTAVATSLIAV